MEAPILRHFDRDRKIYLETDASDFAVAAVVSQLYETDDGQEKKIRLHPVGYYSRKLAAAELNYTVHDKELLAIMEAFVHWSFQFRDNAFPIDIITDHRNLEYFMDKKQLNWRHARWHEFLQEYDFSIRYRPGIKAVRPDALLAEKTITQVRVQVFSRNTTLVTSPRFFPKDGDQKSPRLS